MHVSYKSFRGEKSDGFGNSILLRPGGGGQLDLCLETIHYFEGINVTFLEIIHQFIVYILG